MRARALAALAGGAEFAAAGAALALEIAASRLVAPYLGASIETWSAIIAAFLGGLALGNWLGGLAADSGLPALCRRAAAAFAAAAASFALLPAALPVYAALLPADGVPGPAAAMALVVPAFVPPGLFVGFLSPVLTAVALAAAPGRAGAAIGRMFALGAAGSVAGVLLGGFGLVPWIGLARTIFALAALCAAAALAFAGLARALRRQAAESRA